MPRSPIVSTGISGSGMSASTAMTAASSMVFSATAPMGAFYTRSSASAIRTLSRKELGERLRHLLRLLLREKMPAVDCLAGDIVGPFTPQLQRAANVLVPAVQAAVRTPERKHRTVNAPPRHAIGLVMLPVDAHGGAI